MLDPAPQPDPDSQEAQRKVLEALVGELPAFTPGEDTGQGVLAPEGQEANQFYQSFSPQQPAAPTPASGQPVSPRPSPSLLRCRNRPRYRLRLNHHRAAVSSQANTAALRSFCTPLPLNFCNTPCNSVIAFFWPSFSSLIISKLASPGMYLMNPFFAALFNVISASALQGTMR